jgi:hypothetical protein
MPHTVLNAARPNLFQRDRLDDHSAPRVVHRVAQVQRATRGPGVVVRGLRHATWPAHLVTSTLARAVQPRRLGVRLGAGRDRREVLQAVHAEPPQPMVGAQRQRLVVQVLGPYGVGRGQGGLFERVGGDPWHADPPGRGERLSTGCG